MLQGRPSTKREITTLSDRGREIETLDAEIADLEAEMWRIGALRAAKIAHRSFLAAAENFPMPRPPDVGGGNRIGRPAPSKEHGGVIARLGGRPKSEAGGDDPASSIGRTDLAQVMSNASPGQKAAIPMIASLLAEYAPAGVAAEEFQRRIVDRGVVSSSVLSKALTGMTKAGLITFSRNSGLWFAAGSSSASGAGQPGPTSARISGEQT